MTLADNGASLKKIETQAHVFVPFEVKNGKIFVVESIDPATDTDSLRTQLLRMPQVRTVSHLYGPPDADPETLRDWLIPSGEIVATIRMPDTTALAHRGLRVRRKLNYLENGVVLQVMPEGNADSLIAANQLVEDGIAEQAEPNWIRKFGRRDVESRHS